jgi:5,10-methylenetetrahydromethanopterin reductase
MGLGAVRLADMEDYIQVVQALLAGETVETEIEGKKRLIRLLNPELGLINTRDPIPLYIAATGRRARTLTAKLGAGWINTGGDVAGATAGMREMQGLWAEAFQPRDTLDSVVLTGGAILEPGEAYDSDRVIAQAGPRAAMLLHRAADQALGNFPPLAAIPPALADTVAAYVETAFHFRPQGAHYLENHRGHLMFVKPEERPFVTADLIRATTITGSESEIKHSLAGFAAAGYSEVAIQIVPGQEHAIEDWGRIRRAFA